jgi:hypothetical protein
LYLKLQDIIELANLLFERSNGAYGDGGSGRTNIDRQSLVSGLQKHGGGIKSTIIQELNQQIDKLRNQIDESQRQKQGLDEQNQKMLWVIAKSKPLVEFLDGSDHSFSNDNDNVKALVMIAGPLQGKLFYQDLHAQDRTFTTWFN